MLVCSVNLQHCYQSCFKVEIFSEGSISRNLFSGEISSAFHSIPISVFHENIFETQVTLVKQIFRQPKKYPLLIQRSRPSRDSQEPKTKIVFQFSRGLFQKIPFLYFFLHKSWIWKSLGHVTKKNCNCHFHNASKENFWPKNF